MCSGEENVVADLKMIKEVRFQCVDTWNFVVIQGEKQKLKK